MEIITDSIKLKQKEIINFLELSLKLNKEISGVYNLSADNKIVNHDYKPKFEINESFNIGCTNSVNQCIIPKSKKYSQVPFHTHLNENSPPSGEDIINLVYNTFKEKNLNYCFIIDKSFNIFIYSLNASLTNESFTVLQKNNSNSIVKWRDQLKENINSLVKQYYIEIKNIKLDKNTKQYNKKLNKINYVYMYSMMQLGVEIKIFNLFS